MGAAVEMYAPGRENRQANALTPPPWPRKTCVTKPPWVSHTLTVPSADPVANTVASELGMRGETERERIGEGWVCARVSWRVNVRKGIVVVG